MNAKYTLIGAVAFAAMMSGCATTEKGPEAVYYSGGESTLVDGTVVPKTRREMHSEVAQAYREGILHPIGEEWAYPYVPPCTPQTAWQC